MLVPLTRTAFEQLVPLVATYPQYCYVWGRLPDALRRVLISVTAVTVLWLASLFLSDDNDPVLFLIGFAAGLYWFWGPIWTASRRNARYRRFPYSGFWEGEVLDAYVTEEPIGREETVDDDGNLVIVESREKRLNVEVGDETGFTTTVQARLQRDHRGVVPGLTVQMLVLSDRPDLARIAATTDLYVPGRRIWVSDYPWLQREQFESTSAQLGRRRDRPRDRRSARREPPQPDPRAGALRRRPRPPYPPRDF